jgi:hypothetical protein
MPWHEVPIDPAAEEQMPALEELLACPTLSAPQELAEAMAKIDSLRHGKAVELLTAHFDAVGYPAKPPEGKEGAEGGNEDAEKGESQKEELPSTDKEKEEKRESEPGAKEGKKKAVEDGEEEEAPVDVDELARELVRKGEATMRDWYMECANEEPPEDPLVREAVDKIREMRNFEDECEGMLGDVNYLLQLLDTIQGQHKQVGSSSSSHRE